MISFYFSPLNVFLFFIFLLFLCCYFFLVVHSLSCTSKMQSMRKCMPYACTATTITFNFEILGNSKCQTHIFNQIWKAFFLLKMETMHKYFVVCSPPCRCQLKFELPKIQFGKRFNVWWEKLAFIGLLVNRRRNRTTRSSASTSVCLKFTRKVIELQPSKQAKSDSETKPDKETANNCCVTIN